MEKAKVNTKIAVQAYKFNGWLYRCWEFPTVLKETDEYICVSSQGAVVITNHPGTNRYFRSKINQPYIWYFFKNEWYNIMLQRKQKHLKAYINIASPYIYESQTIKYIDFDLDFVNQSYERTHDLKLVDSKEFEVNAKQMQYPQALRSKIIKTAEELNEKSARGELDKYFNLGYLNWSGKHHYAQKRLLRNKIKKNKPFNRSKKI